mmetsp:Transcript_12079/g.50835  ORF Transcript_12079/g.50835 Transcript_12079/m.50835 type:complete len:204 (+) Transcript_12079:1127-1738(+)
MRRKHSARSTTTRRPSTRKPPMLMHSSCLFSSKCSSNRNSSNRNSTKCSSPTSSGSCSSSCSNSSSCSSSSSSRRNSSRHSSSRWEAPIPCTLQACRRTRSTWAPQCTSSMHSSLVATVCTRKPTALATRLLPAPPGSVLSAGLRRSKWTTWRSSSARLCVTFSGRRRTWTCSLCMGPRKAGCSATCTTPARAVAGMALPPPT